MIIKLSNNNIISILGPTTSGKTKFAVNLAKKISTEIISFDSRQFYKELKIGTNIPSKIEMDGIKHHFIGNKSIIDNYNVFDFAKEALNTIHQLLKKYKTIILVGGSGLYEKAIIEGLHEIPKIPLNIRIKIIEDYKNLGLVFLQKELKQKDYEYFKKIDIKNPVRLIRGLEVIKFTGKSILFFQKKSKNKRKFKVKKIGLEVAKEIFYNKITQRVDNMIEKGLIEEVNSLRNYQNFNALKTIGYTELFKYFNNKISLDTAISDIKKNTKKYAKRQLTWFKKDKNIEWINFNDKIQIVI